MTREQMDEALEEARGEIERTHRWIDEQLRLLLPGWYVRLLLRTRCTWLARLTGIEIHYFTAPGKLTPTAVHIVKHGRIRAVKITKRQK